MKGKLEEFQKLVIENAKASKGLQVGESAPVFDLPNAVGRLISLSQTLIKGPVILKFYRGEWCPICNLDLRKLQSFLPEFESRNASLLAIGPQNPNEALTMKQKNALGYEVLSDANQEVIKRYKLQFDPGEDYHKRRDLTLLNGDGSKTLPIPATFIVATDGKIVGAHVEANYTERMEPGDILAVLDKL
jgi:peroxiredoxin